VEIAKALNYLHSKGVVHVSGGCPAKAPCLSLLPCLVGLWRQHKPFLVQFFRLLGAALCALLLRAACCLAGN
jgi:hypothetical protein